MALIPTARFATLILEDGLSQFWMISVFGPMFCCLLLVIWWLTASRATWKERLFGFIGLIASLMLTLLFVDPSMRGAGTSYFTLPIVTGSTGVFLRLNPVTGEIVWRQDLRKLAARETPMWGFAASPPFVAVRW